MSTVRLIRGEIVQITMPNKSKSQNKSPTDEDQLEPKEEPRQHVPYILNGELYRIQSQIGDNVTVKCCYCPPDRIYRGSVRSTGNFHMHIKRRHASLLGKLHEMKVAALVERRDRIMKNRRFGKARKKATTPPCSAVDEAALATIAATKSAENNHELKIKTVFQRHKQEHHKQEEAMAMRSSTSACDSSLEHNSSNNNNNNLPNPPQIVSNPPNSNPIVVEALVVNQDNGAGVINSAQLNFDQATPVANTVMLSRFMPFNMIKPEQQTLPLTDPEPEAIDLSRSSLASDGSERSTANCLTATPMPRSLELSHYMGGPPRDVLMRIDNTLSEIQQELQTRNQIEHKRFMLEVAKFKFQNPNFNFEPMQL